MIDILRNKLNIFKGTSKIHTSYLEVEEFNKWFLNKYGNSRYIKMRFIDIVVVDKYIDENFNNSRLFSSFDRKEFLNKVISNWFSKNIENE